MNRFLAHFIWLAVALLGVVQAAESPVQLNDINGVAHTPLSVKDAQAVVLLFIAPDCPISNAYVPEIKRIAADYATNHVPMYLVYVDPDLTPADVKKHVDQFALTPIALLDPKHALAKKAGATVTPQAVVISPSGEIQYRGRIDDLYLDFGKRQDHPHQRDLRNALNAILAGKPVAVKETLSIGCYIGGVN